MGNGLRIGTQETDAVLSTAKFQDALINRVILCVTAQNAVGADGLCCGSKFFASSETVCAVSAFDKIYLASLIGKKLA